MGVYAAANEREIGQAETRRKRKGDEQFIVGLSIQNKKVDIHAHRADKCKGNIPYFHGMKRGMLIRQISKSTRRS